MIEMLGDVNVRIAAIAILSILSSLGLVAGGALLHYYPKRDVGLIVLMTGFVLVALTFFAATAGASPRFSMAVATITSRQAGDANFCVWLAVTFLLEISALLAVADDGDLGVATFLDELGRDLCTGDVGSAY